MLLSEIAIAAVALLCMLGLLRLVYVNKREAEKEIAELRERIEITDKTVKTLTDAVNELFIRMKEREDFYTESAQQIKEWNDGVANILNYSLDIAKGGGK